MSFPHDDPAWASTAAFLRERLLPADRLLAPAPFRFAIPRAEDFGGAVDAAPAAFAWVVVHKGELDQLPYRFLTTLPQDAHPVFANDVFVVFATAADPSLPDLAETGHVAAFWSGLEAILRAGAPPGAARPQRSAGPGRPWLTLGSHRATAREAAFQDELDRLVGEYLDFATDRSVLDIGCGAGRLATSLPGARIIGIDTDAQALLRAGQRHPVARMEPTMLGFRDASFDAVVLRDCLDEMPDPEGALDEAARVLARGGHLLLSATNPDNLFARARRRLGVVAPQAGFTLAGLTGMLRAVGLRVIRSDGLMLPMAWALPGAAPGLAALEDDPEFLEAARILGRRAGPDYALACVLLARKG